MNVDKRYAKKVTKQNYGSRATIEGVRVIDLRRHLDDQGEFAELGRLQQGILEGLPGFEIRQINHSLLQPGAVKAWHLHEKQDDVWFVPPDERLLVGLLDVRAGSKTVGAMQRLILGDGQARLLFIPRGVAHGAANLYPRAARILYFVNQTFDPKAPDELRLPVDTAGADFWMMSQG